MAASSLDFEPASGPVRRIIRLGLCGALLFTLGVSSYLALSSQPYAKDESSHVGYALSLREGVLPSVDTPVPIEGRGPDLIASVTQPYPWGYRDIHVAYNPPHIYAVSVPFIEAVIRLDISNGPLLVMRFVDLAGAVLSVGLAYLLGRELSGGDEFVGLGTAALLSSVIGISFVSSVAAIDGPALAATTGVTWALAKFARTHTLREATTLGIWVAAAAAVRPMAAVFAGVAAGIALLIGMRARGASSLLPLSIRTGGPAVLATGWFYALNLARYGDVTSTSRFAEKFNSDGGPGFFDVLLGPQPFVQTTTYLLAEVYGAAAWWSYQGLPQYLIPAAVVAVMAGAIAIAFRQSGRTSSDPPRIVPAAWIGVAVLAFVPMVLTAQHLSNGGGGHPRYLFPLLPVAGAACMLVATRLSYWLGAAIVGGFAFLQLSRIETAADIRRASDPLVSDLVLAFAVLVAIAGCLAMMVATIWLARTPRQEDHEVERPRADASAIS